ncbi:hypothetical protein HK102_007536 [Quaeritorhiza haematococci]|nr:hypothetical protein HK102_007536 [Quaeritorhiza haematococci]
MRGQKVGPYEGGTRVPSLWRWPAKIRGGRDVSALTAHVDVFPTLLEALGIEPTEEVRRQVEGRSLVPFFQDRPVDWPRRTLVTHVGRWPRGQVDAFKFKGVSIRDDRYALVNDAELYDLQADPDENRNLAADPAQAETLRELTERWEAGWRGALPKAGTP